MPMGHGRGVPSICTGPFISDRLINGPGQPVIDWIDTLLSSANTTSTCSLEHLQRIFAPYNLLQGLIY
jgi:hypothetical protein